MRAARTAALAGRIVNEVAPAAIVQFVSRPHLTRSPGDEVLRAAIRRYVSAVVDGQEHRSAALTRDYPCFHGSAAIGDAPDEVARAIDAIGRRVTGDQRRKHGSVPVGTWRGRSQKSACKEFGQHRCLSANPAAARAMDRPQAKGRSFIGELRESFCETIH
jgi:hypothetical protein